MESEEGRRKETVIDSTASPAPAPAIKGEDLASFLNKFAQTLVTAIMTKSHDHANHKHEPGEKCCHFCGELGHFLSDCLKVLKYIEEGKIHKNQKGHIVLSSGAYIPRNIPGQWISDQVDEWHRKNPGQLIKGQLSSNTSVTMLFFEVNHVKKVTEEGTASTMTLSADDHIKALEHKILVLRKRQIFNGVEITRKAPVWKGKEPMGKESQLVTSSSRIPVELQEPLIHSAPLHITPSQAVPSQPASLQNEQSQPVPPVHIVQENTPPPVAEKEPPVHPFAGLPESNYIPPSIRNFAAPVDKNINNEKEPAYKTVTPIQNPKVADAIYERSIKSPSVTISPEELLSLSPDIRQKMRDAVMPKRVLTSDESATVTTHYNSEVPQLISH